MIASWMEFFAAVERMRDQQKLYYMYRNPKRLADVKECEAAVDECIEQRRAEWARREQPEII